MFKILCFSENIIVENTGKHGQYVQHLPCMLADTTIITEVAELQITTPQLQFASGWFLLPITALPCHIVKE